MNQSRSIEALLTKAFAVLPHPLMVLDASGRVVAVTDSCCRVCDTVAAKFVGAEVLSRLQSLDEPGTVSLRALVEGVDEKTGVWKGRVALLDEACDRSFLLEGQLIRDGQALAGVILLFQPLMEDDTLTRQEYKLELLGGLAGGVAHDLNNILAGVLGHLSFMRLSLPEIGPHAESLQVIEDGARMAASISNQVLEFTRGEQAKKRWVELQKVVSSSASLLRSALSKEVSLRLGFGDKPLYVFGEETLLAQMFMNLAINARDALPDGGQIIVQLEPVQLKRRPGLKGGLYAHLTISDNGIGIPEEIRSRIFEPFFTTKLKSGTGLGLANVYSIIEGYGGRIRVASEEGSGSTFEVFLPARLDPPAEPKSEPRALPAGGSEAILVVEDEDIVRTVMQRSLEHLGYEVDVASNGAEAVRIYRAAVGKYSLVILDMMMPGMSGDEVFTALRQVDPEVRVLIASGYSSDERVKSVLSAGALGFIQKPFAVEELAQKVRGCLDSAED